MDADEHRTAIATEGGRLADLPVAGLRSPVAACTGWDVERLVGHVGRVHRWAAAFLATAPDDAAGGRVDAGPRPPSGPAILPWYGESLEILLAELDRHDPDERVPSFAGPTTAAFWYRRQAHELAVHRWDAEDAVTSGAATAVAPALAADGVDEWLGFFVPRFLARGGGVPAELVGATLHVHSADEDLPAGSGEWLLRLTADGAEVERAHAKGDAALRGPASDLLLTTWHRLPLAAVDVVGDADRARRILDLVHVT